MIEALGISVSQTAFEILAQAADRRGNLCPMWVKANAETMLLNSLTRKGLSDGDGSPFITAKGRDFVKEVRAC